MSSRIERPKTPSGRTLSVSDPELRRLHDHAVRGYPHEVVGLLAGDRSTDTVTRVVPLENETADDPARRFRVNGLKLMRAEQAVEADGLDVVGYYHSHPDHPANWSDTDREQALPDVAYVIAAVQGSPSPHVSDTQGWRLRDDRAVMLHQPVLSTD